MTGDYDFGRDHFGGDDGGDAGRKAIEGGNIVPLPGMEAPRIRATPFVPRAFGSLPRQQFLYGFELQRGH